MVSPRMDADLLSSLPAVHKHGTGVVQTQGQHASCMCHRSRSQLPLYSRTECYNAGRLVVVGQEVKMCGM
jgi:hypothetical protein